MNLALKDTVDDVDQWLKEHFISLRGANIRSDFLLKKQAVVDKER